MNFDAGQYALCCQMLGVHEVGFSDSLRSLRETSNCSFRSYYDSFLEALIGFGQRVCEGKKGSQQIAALRCRESYRSCKHHASVSTASAIAASVAFSAPACSHCTSEHIHYVGLAILAQDVPRKNALAQQVRKQTIALTVRTPAFGGKELFATLQFHVNPKYNTRTEATCIFWSYGSSHKKGLLLQRHSPQTSLSSSSKGSSQSCYGVSSRHPIKHRSSIVVNTLYKGTRRCTTTGMSTTFSNELHLCNLHGPLDHLHSWHCHCCTIVSVQHCVDEQNLLRLRAVLLNLNCWSLPLHDLGDVRHLVDEFHRWNLQNPAQP